MAICPFADQSQRYDAAWPMSYASGPWRGLLHTTEGVGVPPYADDRGRKGAKAPHFTVVPDFGRQQVVVYQHFDTGRPSRALANSTAPGETNREQVVQIELVGTCGWVYTVAPHSKAMLWPEAPEWALAGLRRLMRWIEQAHGIPSTSTPRRWTAWNARPDKMSPAEWDTFAGWCGHQHVPENDHTDPGRLPIGSLLATESEQESQEEDVPLRSDMIAAPDGSGKSVRASDVITATHRLAEQAAVRAGASEALGRETVALLREILDALKARP